MVTCPGCKQPLEASGELDVDGQTLGVYQCDRCVLDWRLDGEVFPAALTFALDADGRLLDPASLEPLDLAAVRVL